MLTFTNGIFTDGFGIRKVNYGDEYLYVSTQELQKFICGYWDVVDELTLADGKKLTIIENSRTLDIMAVDNN